MMGGAPNSAHAEIGRHRKQDCARSFPLKFWNATQLAAVFDGPAGRLNARSPPLSRDALSWSPSQSPHQPPVGPSRMLQGVSHRTLPHEQLWGTARLRRLASCVRARQPSRLPQMSGTHAACSTRLCRNASLARCNCSAVTQQTFWTIGQWRSGMPLSRHL
jgi:hypothetical protein